MPTARIQAIATRSRTTLLCLPERATQECARETVETDQEITYYARVVQSLRGDIPVEALIQWSWAANKHSAVSSPKTELYLLCPCLLQGGKKTAGHAGIFCSGGQYPRPGYL